MEAEKETIKPAGPVPGSILGDIKPNDRAGLEQWLEGLGGTMKDKAARYADILEDDGVCCLTEFNLCEQELTGDLNIPRGHARKICEGIAALYDNQGWSRAPVYVPVPQRKGDAEDSAGRDAQGSSGPLPPLPNCPSFSPAGVVSRDEADEYLTRLIAWLND